MLVAMGLARMGALLKFIPYPVTVGFTGGIAIIIFSSQIRDFLGLTMEQVPVGFVEKWIAYSRSFGTLNLHALGIGCGALVLSLLIPRFTRRIPGPLVAILVMTAVAQLADLPVETIGRRVRSVPGHLPFPQIPHVSWPLVREVFPSAVTIAMLAALESLLAAV